MGRREQPCRPHPVGVCSTRVDARDGGPAARSGAGVVSPGRLVGLSAASGLAVDAAWWHSNLAALAWIGVAALAVAVHHTRSDRETCLSCPPTR